MRIKLLGASAGGAFPQWNCACPNCRAVREGGAGFKGRARTQSQAAVSSDGKSWFLLNASPDIRFQIEANAELRPRASSGEIRHTPIAGAVLTNADLDHVLGLLLLRESQPLHVYATASVRAILTEDNSMFRMLEQIPGQVKWTEISPGRAFELAGPSGESSGIVCEAISIPSRFPYYVPQERARELKLPEAVQALLVSARGSSKKMAYLPGIPALDAEWLKRLSECDLVLCDGTFWSDDELKKLCGAKRSSREMGHIPMSGPGGSVELLSALKRPKKIFTHINNTNPVLNEAGAEYETVKRAGIELGQDGMEFEL